MKIKLICILMLFTSLYLTACNGSGSSAALITISSLSESSIIVGESATAVVSIQSLSAPTAVSIVNNESAVVTISPSTCTLTPDEKSCTVTVTGLSVGSGATFTVSSSGYESETSGSIAVIPNYVYFASSNVNDNTNQYTQCSVNYTGIESDTCSNVSLHIPQDDMLTSVTVANGFAYFVVHGWFGYGGYVQCNIDDSGIESNTCINVFPDVFGRNGGQTGLTIYDGFAYFSNIPGSFGAINGGYTQCVVDDTGIKPNTCQNVSLGASILGGAFPLTVNNGFIYFANSLENLNSYTQCTVGTSGIESSTCAMINMESMILNNPYGLAINNNIAYFSDSNINGSYTQCTVGTSGIESNTCAATNVAALGNNQALYGTAINHGSIYFTNTVGNSYTQCSINNFGIESSTCRTINLPLLDEPIAVAFQ